MQRFRKILVAIKADHIPRGLLARAASVAKRDGASLKLISVMEDIPWYSRLILPDAEEFRTLIARDTAVTLEELAGPIRRDGITVTTGVLRGRRDVETVREVLRGGHDLLMKEAEPNEKVLFGSTDMHLLRTCPCPLWLMHPAQGDRPFAQVLATVDPPHPTDDADILHLKADPGTKDAALDRKILDLAGSLASGDGAELHVLHAWSAPGEELLQGEAMLSQDQVDRYVDDSRIEARKALDLLLEKIPGEPGRRHLHLVKGEPEERIAEFAKAHNVDLIVMGTVARTGIPGLLIGNSAESILQQVECSVLAVKPDSFVSPIQLEE